ncbi:MAG: hypothetical protein KAS32_26585 [Candidatus Peribacteraceae bacterium]|nr:hypothetical protein [Candidatus Peribacteraceae bacterium]
MKKPDQKQEPKKVQPAKKEQIKVSKEDAPLYMVKYLELIFARLGYLIKLFEENKKNG